MSVLSKRELYCSPPLQFGGYTRRYEDSDYVILGVPFDYTSTFRSGARFAPNQIRAASANLETYSLRFGVDAEDIKVGDAGNLDITGDVEETLKRVREVTENFIVDRKLPILIGGEHTLTLGAVEALGEKTAVICFDAHLDLRDEYLGQRITHATFMRRICESIGPENVTVVGVRAVSKEEMKFAEESGVNIIDMMELRRSGTKKCGETLKKFVHDHDEIYISIDMDVLDPSIAPAVQTPEPEGLLLHELLNLLTEGCTRKPKALDLVEVTPIYDNGITSIHAAKIIFETLCLLETLPEK